MIPSTRDEISYSNNADTCHFYDKRFAFSSVQVEEDFHITGYFCGPAHSNYNLNYKSKNITLVFFAVEYWERILAQVLSELFGSSADRRR